MACLVCVLGVPFVLICHDFCTTSVQITGVFWRLPYVCIVYTIILLSVRLRGAYTVPREVFPTCFDAHHLDRHVCASCRSVREDDKHAVCHELKKTVTFTVEVHKHRLNTFLRTTHEVRRVDVLNLACALSLRPIHPSSHRGVAPLAS